MTRNLPHALHRQSGVVLIIALILLVTLTILGVSALSTSTLEERMTSNARDREVAFQAAEAALRAGERDIELGTFIPTDFNDTCDGTPGLCDCDKATTHCLSTDPEDTYWGNTTLDVWGTTGRHRTLPYDIGNIPTLPDYPVAQRPKYIIEFMGYILPTTAAGQAHQTGTASDPQMYRITALGFGQTSNARVMLQSTYLKE